MSHFASGQCCCNLTPCRWSVGHFPIHTPSHPRNGEKGRAKSGTLGSRKPHVAKKKINNMSGTVLFRTLTPVYAPTRQEIGRIEKTGETCGICIAVYIPKLRPSQTLLRTANVAFSHSVVNPIRLSVSPMVVGQTIYFSLLLMMPRYQQ